MTSSESDLSDRPDRPARHSSRPPRGKVRWRRFAVLFVPAMATASVMVGLTSQGVLAASISVAGSPFEVTSTHLQGSGFEQFGGAVTESAVKSHGVAVTVIRNATLANLCQSVSVFGATLRITAGGGGTPVSASNLVVYADSQTGSTAKFGNIVIGQDAGNMSAAGMPGPPGTFGEQASSIAIDNLRQHTWLTTAGTFTMPGFGLSLGKPC